MQRPYRQSRSPKTMNPASAPARAVLFQQLVLAGSLIQAGDMASKAQPHSQASPQVDSLQELVQKASGRCRLRAGYLVSRPHSSTLGQEGPECPRNGRKRPRLPLSPGQGASRRGESGQMSKLSFLTSPGGEGGLSFRADDDEPVVGGQVVLEGDEAAREDSKASDQLKVDKV